ncbi:MAG: hypothetical protein KF701_03970 [Anaerolineales bacterium]|nr:MAG: hypothetical protein KF701_03970 [Anaerolineales bacterium]
MEIQDLIAWLRRYLSAKVLLAALGLAIVLGVAGVYAMFVYLPASTVEERSAALTWIPGPTNTPAPTATPVPTSTPTPAFEPPASGEMGVGAYVQIVGTEGRGLNIRNAPGLSTNIQFLAYDAEVFVVRDGPREVDGLTWWYLVTPVDSARAGWAAGTYLEVVVE